MPSNLFWTAIGLFGVGLLLFWWFDERNDSNSAAETVERVGGRAETVTGGVFGALGSLAVVLVSIALTIGEQLLMTAGELGDLVGQAPVVLGHIAVGVLAWVGLSGMVSLSASQFGWLFVVITLIVLFMRYGRD